MSRAACVLVLDSAKRRPAHLHYHRHAARQHGLEQAVACTSRQDKAQQTCLARPEPDNRAACATTVQAPEVQYGKTVQRLKVGSRSARPWKRILAHPSHACTAAERAGSAGVDTAHRGVWAHGPTAGAPAACPQPTPSIKLTRRAQSRTWTAAGASRTRRPCLGC